MYCPQCQHEDTKVIDSRVLEQKPIVRRRRECEKCWFRFTTFEKPALTEMMVIKKDGTKEPYDKEKLKKAIMIACAKRPVTVDQIDAMIMQLEQKRIQDWQEITSEQIGLDVIVALKNIDEVAYIRFSSVYMEFATAEDFKQRIEQNK